MLLDHLERRMIHGASGKLGTSRAALGRLCAGLDAMSPLKVLARGYAIATREGGVITSVGQAQDGDQISVLVSDGTLSCQVLKKEQRRWRKKS